MESRKDYLRDWPGYQTLALLGPISYICLAPVTFGPGAPIEALTELHLEPKRSVHTAQTDHIYN